MDENYQTYLNRAMRLILPDTYRSQVQHIQQSAKFRSLSEKEHQPVVFPGYTIITPTTVDDPDNATLYTRLKHYQQQIVEQLGEHLFIPVPIESLHLTLADLIWDSAYRDAITEKPDFEPKLRECMAEIFQQYQPLTQDKLIRFQALGLMVMTRAIAVCLAPTEESSYNRILEFRRAIYQNRGLIGLGIEQQYYFTPHITLGYFAAVPSVEEQSYLSDRIINLNQQWLDNEPQEFVVHRAELRKFDDMTRYYREADWPTLKF